MKKLITMALGGALMFATAGQVQATALETSGEYRARAWHLDNYMANKKTTEFWDQRLRLTMTWPVAEGVKLTARADIMEGFWGDKLLVGTTDKDGKTTYAATDNSRKQIDFDWLNLQVTFPNTPVTMTIGRQDCNWGAGYWVAKDNRDRLKVTAKFADTVVLYTFDKYIEVVQYHDTDSLDDRRQHSVGVITKLAGWNFGVIGGVVLDNTATNNDFTLNAADAYAMGKAGPVDIKVEVAVGGGKNDYSDKADVDVSGLIAYVGVSVPAGPVTVGIEGAYASGDDPNTKDENEGILVADYNSPFWSIILFNNLDYDGYGGNSFSKDSGLTNASAAKLSLAVSPAKGLTIYGAAVMAARDQVADGADKGMGTELDLVAMYSFTDNVSFLGGFGYLAAGDYYGDVDNPLGLMVSMNLKF